MNVSATPLLLIVDEISAGTASIDICFDGARVWSIDVRDEDPAGGPHRFAWPQALQPFLTGRTRLSVHDSGSSVELAASETMFDDEAGRTRVTDEVGAPLVINKWGRLGVALEALGEEVQELILERSARLIALLEGLGLRPFVVGGTLLGAVRTGKLLPHDDDADIAYLSEHDSPADVAVEAFRVGSQLVAAGYELRRHSATHMQLLFRDDSGAVEHYIDVFAAFFTTDGKINQPFHVRGDMRRDELLPFGSVEINRLQFPAPADPARWLTVNYDANWRTPIPGYVLETPVATRRRFENWFGSFNLHREFWDERFAHGAVRGGDPQWASGAAWLLAEVAAFSSSTLVDLGCGDGVLTRALAAAHPGPNALGLDYSDVGLHVSRAGAMNDDSVTFAHTNFYRLTALAAPRANGVSGPFDAVANHLFEQLGHRGREQGWRLLRMALRSGGSARFTFNAHHAPDVHFDDPTGWHLTEGELSAEAASYGLRVEFVPLPVTAPSFAERRPIGARVHLGSHATPTSRPGRAA
ncbi:LicD family protein [Leucobacter luti]|uniref:LicD family protein n=1 Tax=Leucobacter luti TaxID=340320 RepID=A0A4R6RSK4_9MICO|nr:class I SAM-dependent methyltransferase [Leucobacter luti]TDP89859.1 LicD family protein [Leucobacter luti]